MGLANSKRSGGGAGNSFLGPWTPTRAGVKRVRVKPNGEPRRIMLPIPTRSSSRSNDTKPTPPPPTSLVTPSSSPSTATHKPQNLAAPASIHSSPRSVRRPPPPTRRQSPLQKSLSGSGKEVECHHVAETPVEARAESFFWIADQLERHAAAAVAQVVKYLGTEYDNRVEYRACFDGVDVVRNRLVDVPLDAFARCLWGTLTSAATTPEWSVRILERMDDSTLYTQVMLLSSQPTNDDRLEKALDQPAMALNLLHRRIRTKDGVTLAFRNVLDDPLWPVVDDVCVRVSGWVVLTRDKHATHAQTLVKFRMRRKPVARTNDDKAVTSLLHHGPHITDFDLTATDWLQDMAARLVGIVNDTTTTKLKKSGSESRIASGYQAKHSAASNGSVLKSR
ncbi:Aste57867_806 [Aphanomyces stellatus]|uniref:Aste57867_806 protein n=1 Tax=Aphanomyces stellatus TaxID=120398 RepID=A0A485K6T3_9STRA|nr:hypothetical protein As57867_000805 [Aphanomyces stellatus]VFT78030.1 Aste57867_806 [Aphanomyces stellatus]